MRIMCQVGDFNHTRAGHKWAHSLEVLLTHPTTKFFQVSTYIFRQLTVPNLCYLDFCESQKVLKGADHL